MTPREKAQVSQRAARWKDAEGRNRTGLVEGFYQIRLTAWTDGKVVIVPEQRGLELPGEGEEDDHDCDAMGCGWEHVIGRFNVPAKRGGK